MFEKIMAGIWSVISFVGMWLIFYIPHYFDLDLIGSWYAFPLWITFGGFMALLISITAHYFTKLEDLKKKKEKK